MNFRTKIGMGLAAGVAGVQLLVGGLLVWSWVKNPAPRLAGVDVRAPKEIHIGDRVAVAAVVECPWYRLPASGWQVKVPEGMQLLGTGARKLQGGGWLTWKWACVMEFQPMATGRCEGGSAEVGFTRGRGAGGVPLGVRIPPVEVKPALAPEDRTLRMAEAVGRSWLPPALAWWQYCVLGAVALLILAAVLLLFLKPSRRLPPPLRRDPPWETARSALRLLEDSLPLLAPEPFFVRFTDILRRYCEERFLLRAAESTTQEFLEDVRRNETLRPEQRQALAGVLALADEIKFAKGDATEEQMEAVLVSARAFVEETVPSPEQPENQ